MRFVLTGLVVLAVTIAVSMAQARLSLLDRLPNASALQVSQVQSEAQTMLMAGILFVLAVIAFGVLFPPGFRLPDKSSSTSTADTTRHQ